MKITKEKLFKKFKTLTTNKQKYDYLKPSFLNSDEE